MTDLSPAAQAVLDAVEDHGQFSYSQLAAAALRTVADELVKEDDVWFAKTDDILERNAIEWVPYHSIISVARELELFDVRKSYV